MPAQDAALRSPAARPRRLLHVGVGNLFGGVESVLINFANCRALCPELDVEFAVCYSGRLEDELRASGAAVHRLAPARFSRPWTLLKPRRALAELLRTERFDAVACHMPWTQLVFGSTVRRCGPAYIAYLHGPASNHWLERFAGRTQPDLIVAPSEYTLQSFRPLFRDRRAAGRRELVVHNPIPLKLLEAPSLSPARRDDIRRSLGASADDVVVLTACRFEPWKGIDVVVEALAQLADLPNWKLWIAGGVQKPDEAEYRAAIERLGRERGIADRIALLGQRADVPELMAAADIYSQGNRGPEGFSMSFVEACYLGKPIVTTALGGTPELLDTSTGAVLPAGDLAGFAQALRLLISEPARRAASGRAARERATEKCDPAGQVRRFAEAIDKMTTARPLAARSTPQEVS
jgi:glycosyltransferase involved in cell wall biosynthesis